MAETTKSMVVALAKAAAAALNAAPAGTFGTAFTALVRFVAVRDPAKIPDYGQPARQPAEPLVVIVPIVDNETRLGSGRMFEGDYELDLTIYSRVGSGDAADAACEALFELRQEMRDYLKRTPLSVSGARQAVATLMAVGGSPAFDEAVLWDQGVLASPSTLKFKLAAC